MHLVFILAVQFLELHGQSHSRINSSDRAHSVELAVIDGKNQFEFGAGGDDGAGLNVAAAQADVGEVGEKRTVQRYRDGLRW